MQYTTHANKKHCHLVHSAVLHATQNSP